MPNNSGKISEHCMDMRVVLEGAQFFSLPGPDLGRMPAFVRFNNQITENVMEEKERKKKKWRDGNT